ncbi:MAG TPA: SAM-dependent methyltransferase [Oligoflexus sp.]|uniref:SAM-dependent methyltransferase n=1 Tax=Oligoflexus sp. TaxID=1971216 RepID=UPI002D394AF4|nr:SAM-dependent methyltransferase [Oligoflexus sp.]HYX38201.1 SAM-dependent methyltransferase [Oligoflexus sp.]
MQPSELSVVGLGSGHLDHVTLGGLALLKDADAIIQDGYLNADLGTVGSPHKRNIVHAATQDVGRMEAECRQVVDLIRSGSKVVRLTYDDPDHKKRLELELKILRRLGVKKRFVPSLQALHHEAWNLRLPWLSEAAPSNFRVIPSTQVRGDRNFWRYLADEAQTLALDVGRGKLENFMERLLLAGADPERPVALVDHHPTQSPICWLTTLEEVDELLPQWKPQGATIVYIGTWPHAIRDTESNKSFWGSLEAAAEVWLRAQRAQRA